MSADVKLVSSCRVIAAFEAQAYAPSQPQGRAYTEVYGGISSALVCGELTSDADEGVRIHFTNASIAPEVIGQIAGSDP